EQARADEERLRDGVMFHGAQQYAPFFYDRLVSLIDYLPRGALLVVDEPHRVREQMGLYASDFAEEHSRQLENGRVLPEEMALCLDWEQALKAAASRRVAYFSSLHKTVPGLDGVPVVSVSARSPEQLRGHTEQFIQSVQEWLRSGFKVTLVTTTEERLRRLADTLTGEGMAFEERKSVV